MNRRKFIETSSLMAAASMLPFASCEEEERKPQFKMGYQLFSVNEDMKQDPIGTLKALKAMGYEDFEIYGYDPEKVTYYGIPAQDFKSQLDELALSVTSGHYGFSNYFSKSEDERKRFVDQVIQGAKALNSPYITWPWVAPENRNIDDYKILARQLNKIGEQISAAGLGFAYHNHGYEFEDQNGELCYDIIMNDTDPALVKLQLDMYWVMHSSKEEPKEWIAKQPGRFVMWHIKDMDKVTRDYTELGNGSIDYLTILPDPKVSGLEYAYIEQGGNFTHNPMQSASDSAKYYKANLQKFL